MIPAQQNKMEIKVKITVKPFECYYEEIPQLKKTYERLLPDDSTVGYLLVKLSVELGNSFQKTIFNPDTMSLIDNSIIFINGIAMQCLNGFETKLSDGDSIIIGRTYTSG
ncbi:MAG: hypothetical protein K0Q47_306 [Sedimentibacter sp.]|jgi:molybdopterin converting factor small subunit|nr:hypothetical protein [Sedimentibacter sp.]